MVLTPKRRAVLDTLSAVQPYNTRSVFERSKATSMRATSHILAALVSGGLAAKSTAGGVIYWVLPGSEQSSAV